MWFGQNIGRFFHKNIWLPWNLSTEFEHISWRIIFYHFNSNLSVLTTGIFLHFLFRRFLKLLRFLGEKHLFCNTVPKLCHHTKKQPVQTPPHCEDVTFVLTNFPSFWVALPNLPFSN
jgi:hypothetical protein